MSSRFLAASLLVGAAFAQAPGTNTAEVHPPLLSQRCTKAGGCVTANTSVVLDAQYRWLHNTGGYTNCVVNGAFSPTFCPTEAACGSNCSLEGVDYSSYGINATGSTLKLNLFTGTGASVSASSPRVYLMENETAYSMFTLLNQEFTFDVDVSLVPCGVNGALYFSEMPEDGGASAMNTAGAKYGTGYCDAQCPVNNFVNGMANLNHTLGACCSEMDIWEANSAATAFTPHTCNITATYACSGAACSGAGVCDQSGCDYNAYRMGNTSFYGPNKTVDTTKPFTVVTQFLTSDGTSTGTLKTINRIYVQGGRVITNSKVNIPNMPITNAIDDDYCNNETKALGGANTFEKQGGMAGMGQALARGMVLALSIWQDNSSGMLWLDGAYPTTSTATDPGVARGPCSATSGNPADIQAQYPDTAVTFSNIKTGEIGSTYMSMPM